MTWSVSPGNKKWQGRIGGKTISKKKNIDMRRVSSGDLWRFVPNITTGMGMKYQQVPGDQDSPLLVKESN